MIHADENKIIIMKFLLFGLRIFQGKVFCDMLFSLKKYYIVLLYTRYFTDPSLPLFYIAALYFCNLFNMCNVLFVLEWNFKAIFWIVQLP